ncbi:DUF1266 domain-containing protein [Gordonia insulae]|uniref:DUF1266 domain-containing protein n=1 Tax=Gordonia insulae TaxID=2420509 RepID=UPI000F5BC692|nr:DUF1266 domain-containing protein [Gordonia insulae]
MPIPPITPFPFGERSSLGRRFLWQADTPLPERRQAALDVGAHMWIPNQFACDSITIGESAESARRRLHEWWDVTDAISARKTVGQLLDGMHSSTFEVIAPLVAEAMKKTAGHDPSAHREFLATRAAARGSSPGYWITHYDALYTLRTSKVLRNSVTDKYFPTHIRAWDLGRVPFVVRTALRSGYLQEDECWPMLFAALDSARGYYANWRQFAHGVVIGRAYWSAITDIGTTAEKAQVAGDWVNALLVRSDSPWRRLPLWPEEHPQRRVT